MAYRVPAIVVVKGRGKQPWRWRVVARNGEIMVQSEGYVSKAHAIRGFWALYNLLMTSDTILTRAFE